MPSLEEVINQFQVGFQYLDSNNQRQIPISQLILKVGFIRKWLTEEPLTEVLEKIAQQLNTELNMIKLLSKNVNGHYVEFFNIIDKTLKIVKGHRFIHGNIEKENYSHHAHSILEFYLTPKESATFEQQLINGLKKVKEKYPVLEKETNTAIGKIKQDKRPKVLFFREKMEMTYKQYAVDPSFKYDLHQVEERIRYARTEIAPKEQITPLEFFEETGLKQPTI